MAFLNQEQLLKIGLKKLGKNVLISEKASIYGQQNIEIGDNTRIDDFCIISAGSGGISIGRNVHIACYVSLIGSGKIEIQDFAGISSRVSCYSSNDDYSGSFLTGPTVPAKYRNSIDSPVFIGRHVVVGSGSVILPGVSIGSYSSIGALSLVKRNVPENEIHVGTPAKFIKERKRNLVELEKSYLAEIGK